MSYDVRELGNYILDFCWKRGRSLSNIEINKICYFVYEQYLLETGSSLTESKIEAWKYGPVFRELYYEFKEFRKSEIKKKATRFSFESKTFVVAEYEISEIDRKIIDPVIESLANLSAHQMVDLSHVPGGPWDRVFNHPGETNCGMEITDSLILECSDMICSH